jgi:hypothetical protein
MPESPKRNRQKVVALGAAAGVVAGVVVFNFFGRDLPPELPRILQGCSLVVLGVSALSLRAAFPERFANDLPERVRHAVMFAALIAAGCGMLVGHLVGSVLSIIACVVAGLAMLRWPARLFRAS